MRPLNVARHVSFRSHAAKNWAFIAVLVISNTLGNLFLGLGMKSMPEFDTPRLLNYFTALLTNLWIIAGVALLVIWMLAQLSMFTWADLSYVLPVTASSYALTAILGKFFLGEHISLTRWIGIAVISMGVLLVAETPPWTHLEPPRPEEEEP